MNIRIQQFILIIKVYIIKFFSVFLHKEKYWVISERGYDARDNGYQFYLYMKKNHPEKKIYYLISKNSSDLSKIDFEDVCFYNTLKHYFLCINAQCIISTHVYLFFPNCFYKLYKILHIKSKIVFLQHGIIKDLIPFYFKSNNKVDLFITAAIPEYNYIIEEYGYNKDEVKCTGLARYDNLINIEEKMILLMPTWRQNYSFDDESDFKNTIYYKNWSELLKRLDCEKYRDYEIVFYQHYEFQKYSYLFKKYDNNIKIAEMKNYDVQDLLKKTCLLITDYSSVYFDIAYMNKPIIYFQFDENEFFENNYQKGYFNYHVDGFGKVTYTPSETLEQLNFYIDNSFSVEKMYVDRKKGFFKHYDKNNSKRIYTEIIKLVGE